MAGAYRIEGLLGTGSMGYIYRGQRVDGHGTVALKFLHEDAYQDEVARARFQREAALMRSVNSPHVVKVLDSGCDEQGHPFLALEWLAGQDLSERIAQCGRLSQREAKHVAVQLCHGLAAVHDAGILHRDIKPANIYLADSEQGTRVKLVDFGLSKLLEVSKQSEGSDGLRLTQQGALIGTPLYMSPEQIEGLGQVDYRSDIWSVGVILFEMLAGVPPFINASYARLVMAICHEQAPPLRQLNAQVSPYFADVVSRCLRHDPAERYASVLDLLMDLEKVGGQSTPSSSTSQEPADAEDQAASSIEPWLGDEALPARAAAEPKQGASVSGPDGKRQGQNAYDATVAAGGVTRNGATAWLTDAPMFSAWRGEVDAPDRLRIETRDGSVRDLRLSPVGNLNLGRVPQVGDHQNQLVYPDVASRKAARLSHDGIRWWLERLESCSVPAQVGTRQLQRGERAPLVHGTFVNVGAMRAAMVDRRYVSRQLPAGTVDPLSGLLGRGGIEQEVAICMQRETTAGLLLVHVPPHQQEAEHEASVLLAVALHGCWPSAVVARAGNLVVVVCDQRSADAETVAATVRSCAAERKLCLGAAGYWQLAGDASDAGREVELAIDAAHAANGVGVVTDALVDLRAQSAENHVESLDALRKKALDSKRQVLLFGIEEQSALARVGLQVIQALEKELAAMVGTVVGPSAVVGRVAPGVVAASIPRRFTCGTVGAQVQCEWHSRAPINDGKLELPRTLAWELVAGEHLEKRGAELSRECADAHGVLSALGGGLPFPIAGRVQATIAATSQVERVKMLFDVLEGAWRFLAVVLAAAFFSKREHAEAEALSEFYTKLRTRDGLPLGQWRALARMAAKSFDGDDPIGELARQVLRVKVTPNQTFEALSNLMHSERNSFAHGHYSEAKAAADGAAFEQMTRAFLRALRPLAAWTLVTVQRTEPDLYGEMQTVDYIDHTGPSASGARRRVGFLSQQRLANVVYLTRWRDGLVLPLEPFVRRLAHEDRFSLFWMDHLPRVGRCVMSSVVGCDDHRVDCEKRHLPPRLRILASES